MIEERTNKEFKNVDDKSFERFLFYVKKSVYFLTLTSIIENIIRQIAERGELEPKKNRLDDVNIYKLLNKLGTQSIIVPTMKEEMVCFIISFLKIFVVCSKNLLNRQVSILRNVFSFQLRIC